MRYRDLNLPSLMVAAGVLCLPGFAQAAVDPALIVLHAKVNAVGTTLTSVQTKIDVVDQQFDRLFLDREQGLLELDDARRRDFEELLLACAREPARSIAPRFLTSATAQVCLDNPPFATGRRSPPASAGPHTHDTGFACPLNEILLVVKADRDAAEASGLARDYAAADLHIEAARLAALGGDAVTAFREACAGFKRIACP